MTGQNQVTNPMEHTFERTGPAPQHTEGVCRRCGCTDQEPCVHVDKGA